MRALHFGIGTAPRLTKVSILARTEMRALPCMAEAAKHPNEFQSSPAPRCGRYQKQLHDLTISEGFNPRPHRDAGATIAALFRCHHTSVSILARTEMRALQTRLGIQSLCLWVSILARTEMRALPVFVVCYQFYDVVSILARTEMRALLFLKHAPLVNPLFQSSPAPRCGRYHGH